MSKSTKSSKFIKMFKCSKTIPLLYTVSWLIYNKILCNKRYYKILIIYDFKQGVTQPEYFGDIIYKLRKTKGKPRCYAL